MEARIITIGDEILIGQIVDTNSVWLASRLNEIGIRVARRLSVGDEAGEIKAAVSDGLQAAEVVIVTGGLGPTKDDITKTTLAEMFGCGMRRDEWTFEFVRKMTEERGFDFNVLNQGQAMVPECCTVLPNRNGTAPGMWFEHNGSVLVSLPGVPFEMKALMETEVLPRLVKHFNLSAITHKTMQTTGIAESALALAIEAWEDALPEWLHLAYLPSPSGVRLRLSAYEVDNRTAMSEIERRFAEVETIIPDNILGYGEASAESAVAEMLTRAGKTLAVAESCTGGSIASRFTAMAGASGYFRCGVVSYSNEAKVDILGVDMADIERHGAVSREVAEQMAEGARRVGRADYAIATTGIAGPDGGSDEKPVGTVWIAIASAEGVVSKKHSLGNLRGVNIERASTTAINMLRRQMRAEKK